MACAPNPCKASPKDGQLRNTPGAAAPQVIADNTKNSLSILKFTRLLDRRGVIAKAERPAPLTRGTGVSTVGGSRV